MSIDIRLKHSAVNGKAPQPADLSDGELALNINDADPAIYLKDSAGAVRRMDAGAVPPADWTRAGTVLSPTVAGDDVTTTGDVNAANVVATGDVQIASLNSGPLAGFRNHLINGSFDIVQRGGGTATGQTFTGADRWYQTNAATTTEVRSITAGPTSAVPWANFMRVSSTSIGILNQCVELPAAGRPGPFAPNSVWTFSWYTQQDLTDINVGALFAPSSFTSGNAHTVSAPSLTGETVGPFSRVSVQITVDGAIAATDVAFRVYISGANSKTFDVANAQLEPGPVATPFEHRPIGTELALCQRYYQRIDFANVIFNGGSSSSSAKIIANSFTEARNGIPTIAPGVVYTSAGRFEGNSANATSNNVTGGGITERGAHLFIPRTSSTVQDILTVSGQTVETEFSFDYEF